jgi:hypothetical protein
LRFFAAGYRAWPLRGAAADAPRCALCRRCSAMNKKLQLEAESKPRKRFLGIF